jgi:hypothetical protein
VPDALQANMYRIRHAESTMSTEFEIRPDTATIDETLAALAETGRPIYLIVADGTRLKGYVRLDPGFKLWRGREPGTTLGDMARTDFVLVRPTDTMFDVIGRVSRRGAHLAIVVDGARIPRVEHVKGFIALETMGEAAIENARAYTGRSVRDPFPLTYRGRVVSLPFMRRRPK